MTKAAGHQDAIERFELLDVAGREGFGIHVADVDLDVVLETRVTQCLVDGFVTVRQVDIFAHHRDVDLTLWVGHLVYQIVPAVQAGRRGTESKFVADQAIQALFVQQARHFVDGVHIGHGDHTPRRNVGEEGDFFTLFVWNAAVCPAQQRISLNTDFA